MLPEDAYDFVMGLSDDDVWAKMSETTPPVPPTT